MGDAMIGAEEHPTRRNIIKAAGAAAAVAAAPAALAAWQPSDSYPDPNIKALDPSFNKYAPFNAGIEKLYTGARWSEGPVWIGDARCVLLSDIPNDRIL